MALIPIDLKEMTSPPGIQVVWLNDENGENVQHGYICSLIPELRRRLGTYAPKYETLLSKVEASYTPPDAATVRQALLETLNAEYEARMKVLSTNYPPSERESWSVQISEARMLLADPNVSTPWIDQVAALRLTDRAELARRIVAKDEQYRTVHGALTGTRQRFEDLISAAGDNSKALLQIDVKSGWPAQFGG